MQNLPIRSRNRLVLPAFAVGLMGAVVLGGCKKEDDIQVYQAPKEPAHTASAVGPVASAEHPTDSGKPQWDVPEGWKEVGSKESMRAATFAVSPEDPSAQLTVVPLGEIPLNADVERWAKQVGLTDPADMDPAKVVTEVETGAGKAKVVDLTGPGKDGKRTRMLAAIVPHDGKNWYLKLTGPADVVAGQKAKFDAFVKSVHFAAGGGESQASAKPAPSGDLPAGHPSIEPAGPAAPGTTPPAAAGGPETGDGPIAKWTTPAGWERQPASQFRLLSYKAPAAGAAADVSVIGLPVSSFGSPESQVNRWRGQVGLPPVQSVNEAGGEPVKIGGKDATLFDLAGPANRILVAYVPVGDTMWFFKMTGPKDAAGAQKDAFKAFVQSVQFAGQ